MEHLQINNYLLRLAETEADLDAAQALRYRIFYEEMLAVATPETRACRRDSDHFDEICDHLLVIDQDPAGGFGGVHVVGTYRLLRRQVAMKNGGFYSQQEYDLNALLCYPGEIVELGRSCVDPAYRSRGVMQLLWRGLAEYVNSHGIELMFGCASFPGTEPAQMGEQLSYLHHYHLAPSWIRPRALSHHYVAMELMPISAIDTQTALSDLPPLIKGYLRVGGFVGDGAVIDRQFNTTDVCVIVKTDQLTQKYDRRYRRGVGESDVE